MKRENLNYYPPPPHQLHDTNPTRWDKRIRMTSTLQMKVECQECGAVQMTLLVLILLLAMGNAFLEIQRPPTQKKKKKSSSSLSLSTTSSSSSSSTTNYFNLASSTIIGFMVLVESSLCQDQLAFMESIFCALFFHLFMTRLEQHLLFSNDDDRPQNKNNKKKQRTDVRMKMQRKFNIKEDREKSLSIQTIQVHKIPRYLFLVTILVIFWLCLELEEVLESDYYDDHDGNNGWK